jgi:hypothetical protein
MAQLLTEQCREPFVGRVEFSRIWRVVKVSLLGLGRGKTLCRNGQERGGVALRAAFSGFDYARMAAISGWMPMTFITWVRL